MKGISTLLRPIAWSLLVLLTTGCSVTEENIVDYTEENIVDYGKNRKFDKLIQYIEKNQQAPEKVNLVQLAATQLFKYNFIPYPWGNARYRLLYKLEPGLIRHILLVKGDSSSAAFLQRTVIGQVSAASGGPYWKAAQLLTLAVDLRLEPRDSLQAIHTAVVRIQDLEKRLDSLQVGRRDLNYTITDVRDRAAKDEQRLSQNRPVQIYGFIRAQREETYDGVVYEVAINGKSALLVATDTRFETAGNFRLLATELGEYPVTLKPEYGGFTQKWKVYREVPKVELDTRDKQRELLAELQPKLVSLIGDLQRMDKEISEIPQEIENLKEQASRISLFDVFYELNQE